MKRLCVVIVLLAGCNDRQAEIDALKATVAAQDKRIADLESSPLSAENRSATIARLRRELDAEKKALADVTAQIDTSNMELQLVRARPGVDMPGLNGAKL